MIQININDIANKVRSTVLTGLNTALTGAIVATDTVLEAFGKLQNQINGKVSKAGDSMTGDLTMTDASINTADSIGFDTLTPAATIGVGEMRWNDTDGTTERLLKGGNVYLQDGQEIVARVVNKTNINLLESEYRVVKVTSAQGQRLAVNFAQANNDPNSVDTLGIVTENISNNQEGFITILGTIRNINTTGSLQGETWADGDVLYLSPTIPGGITNIKPTAPNHMVSLGYVEYAHANNGKIFVKIQNGYELGELHDVYAPNPTNGQTIRWNSTSSRYENSSLPAYIQLAASDETTALTAGTGKITFRMPHAMTLTGVRASLTTAQASGNIFTVDINENGSSILSTKLTIDNTEKTSTTAATPPVISDTALADDAEITVDIDQIGNGTAKGLKITLIGFIS